MKTRTATASNPRKGPNDKPLPGFRETASETAEREASAPAEDSVKPRISVAINPDGSIDFSSMREATRQKFKEAINSTPSLRDTPAAGGGSVLFNPAMVAGMYSMLGSVEILLAQRVGKISPEIAARVFTYTENEINALIGPTTRVLNKYTADWLLKYQDEIALATLLISMHVMKLNAANMLMRASKVVPIRQEGKEENGEKGAVDGVIPN